MSSVKASKGELNNTCCILSCSLLYIETENKQSFGASAKMNRAMILQIEQLKRREGKTSRFTIVNFFLF